MSTLGWIVLCVLGMAAAWAWKQHTLYKALGLSDGRRFGNQIADAVGLEYNLFHTIFEAGDTPAPTLMMLEDKWGAQPQLQQAKTAIYKLVKMYEEKHQ